VRRMSRSGMRLHQSRKLGYNDFIEVDVLIRRHVDFGRFGLE